MSPGVDARLEVSATTPEVEAALARVAAGWGATLSGAPGDAERGIELPVVAGLRRGLLLGRVAIAAGEPGTSITLRVQETHLRVNAAAVAILLLSAAGGLVTMLWPWVPALLPAAPLGLVLAAGGWLLIASRLRSSGPEEFLGAVCAAALEPDESAAPAGGSPPRLD